jgi:tetratricopeptide (TPR) repeat protein
MQAWTMARIFISHSSHDNEAAAGLLEWLSAEGFEKVFLDFDKEAGIKPGANWETTLYREVKRAQAIIVLQTKNWMQSTWCQVEYSHARALGKAIFPVLDHPVDELQIGGELQAIDLIKDRKGGLDRLGQALRDIAMESSEGFDMPKGVSPFPGMSAFDERLAAVFFGREEEISRLIETLRLRRTSDVAPLIAILGASGSGKSSLMYAGLIPRLKRDIRNWIVLPPFRPEFDPVAMLIDTLMLGTVRPGVALSERQQEQYLERRTAWEADLRGDAPGKCLREIARTIRRVHGALDARILITIDQAEELFTISDRAESVHFMTLLSHILSGRLPFISIATVRSDFLGHLQTAQGLSVPFDPFLLDPMPLERVGALVRGPARLAGLTVEDSFVAALREDAKTADALPLIAYTLQRLYERYGETGAFTLEHYESLGDPTSNLNPLENAVRMAVHEALPSSGPDAVNEQILRDAFVPALVRVNDEGEFVRRPARLADLPENSRAYIDRLVAARLLITHSDTSRRNTTSEDGAMTGRADTHTIVEVAHEALFRVWPQLVRWLEEESEFLIGKSRLEQAVVDWQNLDATQRDRGLLSDLMLDRAKTWVVEHPGRFTDDERAFIAQSSERALGREQRQRNLQRTLTWGAVVAAFIFAGVGVVAWTERNTAIHERGRAEQALNLSAGRARMAALSDMALRRLTQDDAAGAREAAEESLALARQLEVFISDDLGWQSEFSLRLTSIGHVRNMTNDLTGALEAYEESVDMSRELSELDPDNIERQLSILQSLTVIGRLRKANGDDTGALAAHQESAEIARALAELYPEDTLWLEIFTSRLRDIGDLMWAASRLDEAFSAFEESIAYARGFAHNHPADAGWQRGVLQSLRRIADIRRAEGDTDGSLATYEQVLDLYNDLVQLQPDDGELRVELTQILLSVGEARLGADDLTGAISAYDDALAIFQALPEDRVLDVERQREMLRILLRIGDLRTRDRDIIGALIAYEQSNTIAHVRGTLHPDISEWQSDIANSLERIGRARISMGERAHALEAFEDSLRVRRTLATHDPQNTLRRMDLMFALYSVATTTPDTVRRRATLMEAIEIVDALADEGNLYAEYQTWPERLRGMMNEE